MVAAALRCFWEILLSSMFSHLLASVTCLAVFLQSQNVSAFTFKTKILLAFLALFITVFPSLLVPTGQRSDLLRFPNLNPPNVSKWTQIRRSDRSGISFWNRGRIFWHLSWGCGQVSSQLYSHLPSLVKVEDCTTSKGVVKWGTPVTLDDKYTVDLVVVGSTAFLSRYQELEKEKALPN